MAACTGEPPVVQGKLGGDCSFGLDPNRVRKRRFERMTICARGLRHRRDFWMHGSNGASRCGRGCGCRCTDSGNEKDRYRTNRSQPEQRSAAIPGIRNIHNARISQHIHHFWPLWSGPRDRRERNGGSAREANHPECGNDQTQQFLRGEMLWGTGARKTALGASGGGRALHHGLALDLQH